MSVSLDTHTYVGGRGDTCIWRSHWDTLPLHISEGDLYFNFPTRKVPSPLNIWRSIYFVFNAWLRNVYSTGSSTFTTVVSVLCRYTTCQFRPFTTRSLCPPWWQPCLSWGKSSSERASQSCMAMGWGVEGWMEVEGVREVKRVIVCVCMCVCGIISWFDLFLHEAKTHYQQSCNFNQLTSTNSANLIPSSCVWEHAKVVSTASGNVWSACVKQEY